MQLPLFCRSAFYVFVDFLILHRVEVFLLNLFVEFESFVFLSLSSMMSAATIDIISRTRTHVAGMPSQYSARATPESITRSEILSPIVAALLPGHFEVHPLGKVKALNSGGAITPYYFEGASIRAMEIDGEPWFVGKDVAEALGYVNPSDAITTHCKGVANRSPLQTGERKFSTTSAPRYPDRVVTPIRRNTSGSDRMRTSCFPPGV